MVKLLQKTQRALALGYEGIIKDPRADGQCTLRVLGLYALSEKDSKSPPTNQVS